ncbi:hypothetical protein [Thermogemmatispora sp.]|jgi:hypothetical protein|uniref:hypothetical protein n=1 Tax=Thermogemmatispora sp. TaxID=1968838 RepID=UPI0035E42764
MEMHRLNIWIPADLAFYLKERARQERKPVNQLVADLIRKERMGGLHDSLQPLVTTACLEALNQARSLLELQSRLLALQDFLTEMKLRQERGYDRLAALVIRAIREGGLARRLAYATLAKDDPDFALDAYNDAKAKVGKDLASRFSEEDSV